MYSPDSAIDGAVLEVILRKAQAIRDRTGVSVPLPEERAAVSGALMNAVLLRRGRSRQLALDFGLEADASAIDATWRDAEEGERRSRTRFAQNAMHPDEVAGEWCRWRDVLGTPSELRRFVERSFRRLQAPLEPVRPDVADAHLAALPAALRDRLAGRALAGRVRLSFDKAAPGAQTVTRTHPLTAILADALLEGALDPISSPVPALGRVGAWPTRATHTLTTLVLLRLRFKLTTARRGHLLLAEEAEAMAFAPDGALTATGDPARALLEAEAAGDLAPQARARVVGQALARIAAALPGPIAAHAQARAAALAEDHDRVRAADGRRNAGAAQRVTVEPVLPPDVIGVFVLIPAQ